MNHESIVLAFFCSIPYLRVLYSLLWLFGMLSTFRHAVQCLKTRRKTPSAQRAERSFPPPFALSSCGNQRSALFMDFSQKLYKNVGGFPVTDSSVLSL